MYGAAIGDALGSAFEFVASNTIARHLGRPIVSAYERALSGSLLHPRDPGRPTDDTAMAICVAAVIASGNELSAMTFAARFTHDLRRGSGAIAQMFWTGGPGGATMRALGRLERGHAPVDCGAPSDGGNGAAMRAHPIGALASRDHVLGVAALQARITHGHPAAIAAAQAVAVLVHDALHDVPASKDVPAGIADPTFARAWHSAHAAVWTSVDLPTRLRDVDMSGWETVAAAHAITLGYQDPAEAIGRAAASGADTDTIASIVGAIVGARYGFDRLPKALVSDLVVDGTFADCVEALVRSDEQRLR